MNHWHSPWLLALLFAAVAGAAPLESRQSPAPVAMIELRGPIDVPSAEYLERALELAEGERAQCLLILLDTPGGLGEPMEDMTKALLNAPMPTVVYVSPAGAHAMSAGTFVTLAAHIAVMHPISTIGAAHPVSLFSMPELPKEAKGPPDEEKPEESQPQEPRSADVMTEKLVNAFSQRARAIAEARGRNADWAESAVRHSAAVTAKDALQLGVVDLLADDINDLLAAISGREVEVSGRQAVTLDTANAQLMEISASPKERFLHVLADPNMLLVLLVLAGLGIVFELQNPGAILPGVIGGLCLLLSLYSMSVLPVSYAGVALIVFAMLLFIGEVKVISHGVLTVGGIASFVIGALMLVNTPYQSALQVSWQVIVVMAVLVAAFFLLVVGAAVRAHMRRDETGEQGMAKARGRALTKLAPNGSVFVEGERWRARSLEGELQEGEQVEVVGQDGLTLMVRRLEGHKADEPNP